MAIPGPAIAQDDAAQDEAIYAAVKKCFSGLVQAYQDGRWEQVDRASRLWMLRAEAWEIRFGWRSHGDPGTCVNHYRPGQADYPMSEWTLIQYAPADDVRAAYEAEPNAVVRQAFLARWAYSDTFPADVSADARKWATGVLYKSGPRNETDWEDAGHIIHALALKGDQNAQMEIARKPALARRFPEFTMARLVEAGHPGALQYRNWFTPTPPAGQAASGPSTGQIVNQMNELAAYCKTAPSDPKCNSLCRTDPDNWSCQDHSVNWNK